MLVDLDELAGQAARLVAGPFDLDGDLGRAVTEILTSLYGRQADANRPKQVAEAITVDVR